MNETVSDEFIYNWLTTNGPVGHISVDQQAFYNSKLYHKFDVGLHGGQKAFGENVTDFTCTHRPRFKTVHIVDPLDTFDADKLRAEGFRIDHIKYDEKELRAIKVPDGQGNRWFDLINSDYETDMVHFKQDGSAWDGIQGEYFAATLVGQAERKYIGSGAFGEACLRKFILTSPGEFEWLLDPALAWSTFGGTMTADDALGFYGYGAHVTEPGHLVRMLEKLKM